MSMPELVCTNTDPGHVHRWDRCPGHSGEPTENIAFEERRSYRDAITEWREELGYDPITGEAL